MNLKFRIFTPESGILHHAADEIAFEFSWIATVRDWLHPEPDNLASPPPTDFEADPRRYERGWGEGC